MSVQTPITIIESIENIDANRYLLPAIQRDFKFSKERANNRLQRTALCAVAESERYIT